MATTRNDNLPAVPDEDLGAGLRARAGDAVKCGWGTIPR